MPKIQENVLKGDKKDTHEQSEEGDTNRETGIVVMCLQVKEHQGSQQPPEAGRGKEGSSPKSLQRE